MSEETDAWLNSDESKEYFELLRIPSVGAERERLRDCVRCATWLKAWLGRIGAEATLMTEGFAPPVVFAERRGDEGAPTVLVYGHYDVQPAEADGSWLSPPFEPTVRDGRVYCRGSQDDKGQLFALLCGIRAFLDDPERKGPTPTVKLLIDGQEESGSGALSALLASDALRRRVSADVLLVCDTSAAADLRPAIVAGLRGVGHCTLKVTAANRDLHSGEYGGIAPNAAQGLSELVASLHTPDGAVAVAGFRDGIEPPSHEELRLAELSSPSEGDYETDLGCAPCGGQVGRTIVQRNSFEPTVEVNGIHSGYGGAGAKTVIPCEATAKLSMRYVPGQSPRRCFEALKEHLENRCPRGMKIALDEVEVGTGGFRLPLSSPLFRLAEDVLASIDARGPVFVWDGASIPVLSRIREASGAAPLMVGWGQPEDRIHAPNESYSPKQFLLARRWAREIFSALAGS